MGVKDRRAERRYPGFVFRRLGRGFSPDFPFTGDPVLVGPPDAS
jgi:hypothetical protein